ncbi:hypothetical protein I7I51_06736 [Histoplasma capsulatum]|uniref:Uncharacterized protein n=1 Tax=Ajellomyces capsulatus TaxID=5037 RepID=A0A8A1MJ36_AJECA|nr:hypothetical protein I7I51_06736 [Histoplasma capsulatum]
MAYYEPQSWQAPLRQTSWEQPAPPSRSGTSSTSQRDDAAAFSSQFDEVDRAIDNLVKSGKLFNAIPRRDSVPLMMSRPYPDYDPRMMNVMPQRHSAIGDYESLRPHSASNVQGFYAAQRYQGRPNEVEQMMQAKRRMAAQREGELRKYHHQQQIHPKKVDANGLHANAVLCMAMVVLISILMVAWERSITTLARKTKPLAAPQPLQPAYEALPLVV